MKHTNMQIKALALAALMTATAVMSACGGNTAEPETTETDTPVSSEITTTETETETAPAVEVTTTITLKDQRGTPVADAVMRFTSKNADDETEPVTATTGKDGTATVTLVEGTYTVNFDVLPEYHIGGAPTLEVKTGMEPVAYEITDNTPDGSEANPFFVGDTSVKHTIPAGMSYNFSMFGGEHQTLVIISPSAELTYAGATHKPGENGRIELPIVVENPRDHVYFAIKNTAEAEIEITIELHSDPGSLGNPIAVDKLDTPVTATVPNDSIVYYTYTATADGTLKAASADANSNISLSNKTTSQTTDFSAGAPESGAVNVKKGDVVLVIVTAAETVTEEVTYDFSLIFTAA